MMTRLPPSLPQKVYDRKTGVQVGVLTEAAGGEWRLGLGRGEDNLNINIIAPTTRTVDMGQAGTWLEFLSQISRGGPISL